MYLKKCAYNKSPCKDLLLLGRPNLVQKALHLVGTVLYWSKCPQNYCPKMIGKFVYLSQVWTDPLWNQWEKKFKKPRTTYMCQWDLFKFTNLHAIWQGVETNNELCRNFRRKKEEKCIDYALNTLNYAEISTLKKLIIRPFQCAEQ